MDTLLKSEIREKGSGASVKVEGLSKAALMKSLSPRVMLSNRLLPKGTKMKVNLEDQGRQKVSFSFSQTKKPLQSLFFIPASPEKPVAESHASLPQSSTKKMGQNTESLTDKKQTPPVPASLQSTHSQAPVFTPSKLKIEIAKMHFKKQILSVSATEEKSASDVPEGSHTSELVKSSNKTEATFPPPQPQNVVSMCSSGHIDSEAFEANVASTLKKDAVSSGKPAESSSNTEQDNKECRRKTRSQSDSAPPGSESEGDSAKMSSSHKSMESKSMTKIDNRSKEVKKSSSGSNVEEKEKASSKQSENHERSSSYSKSDRDFRRTSSRSSRSDKDRRRTRSRSRSKSRGSRTSSSHSRSERFRSERGLRSDRSYYHDSDRRSHRSSPRRERRRSRSRTDRTRDSSDSDDDHRRMRTRTSDSRRTSRHSSSHKDSKSFSYLKSEKCSKSIELPHSPDKRTQLPKSEKASRRPSDSDSQQKYSPETEPTHHKSSTHHKSETESKTTSCSLHIQSQNETCLKGSSSDSEVDHKEKLQCSGGLSVSDNSTASPEKAIRLDTKLLSSWSSVKTSDDRQSNDIAHSPAKTSSFLTCTKFFSDTETEKLTSEPDSLFKGSERGSENVEDKTSSLGNHAEEEESKELKLDLEMGNENTLAITSDIILKPVNAAQEDLAEVIDILPLNNQSHGGSPVLTTCSSSDNILHSQDKKVVQSLGETETFLNTTDIPVNHDLQPVAKIEDLQPIAKIEDLQPTAKIEDILPSKDLTVMESETSASLTSDSLSAKSDIQVTHGQQITETVKKVTSTPKKSRWDIVGQDTLDGDNSQKIHCTEIKTTVKKVISVKRIEFSKDVIHQTSSENKNVVVETETNFKMGKQDEICKQSISSDSKALKDDCKEQGEALHAPTNTDHCDLKLTAPQNSNTGAELSVNDATQFNQVPIAQSSEIDVYTEPPNDSVHDTTEMISVNQDELGKSESSESDSSEYDSDYDEAIKRLQSVVVVPQNSSLTLDPQDAGTPLCSPVHSSDLQNADVTANMNISDVQVSLNERQESISTALGETIISCTAVNDSPCAMVCQSQSNMIDSTSQAEGSSISSAQSSMAGSSIALESATANQNLALSLDNCRQYEQQHKQHCLTGRDERMHSHYLHNDLTIADNTSGKNMFSQSWDFSQPEQPSSTYQQPDSSHGSQLLSVRLTGVPPDRQEHEQNNTPWNHHPAVMPADIEPCTNVLEHHQDPTSEIHPDSLTNDHGDYSADKPLSLSKTAADISGPVTQGSSSFVQGHEISSNSKGSINEVSLADHLSEDYLRPHRGRGPPKKRRPEVESDSDNEAEPGPAGKRERQMHTDVSKESPVVEMHRPLLTLQDFQDPNQWKDLAKVKSMPPYFDLIEENVYLTERKKSKSHRDIKRMQCECAVLSREERSRGVLACGEDCLNRLLMIECSSRCLNGIYCSNRRFQMKQHADFEVILTEDKGWGLRAAKDLAPNTFVLEYCGEVLDHKEFKTRVKEYARSKNIHYYFMALKNNEIIDATLKGNCSRFMNHSCEPNCETQKWTVNGQLRVGFFTCKAVTAGTELTFDYQFQRYGKEAQKCFCGAPSCRGFLGGENRVSVRAAGGKMKKDRSRKSALNSVDEELEALLENGEGLYDEKQVVSLCRLMVRVETMEQKLICLKLIQHTQNPSCLKQFLDHHGLSLLWIFMVELSESKGNSINNIKLQLEIMKTLAVLPISTKNMLEESRVLTFIQRWAQTKSLLQPAEIDDYSSENTSRAQTPLNMPDGSSTKLATEFDGDAPKPAVYPRLKIISENSLDSALSDASKASDGKEEEEDEDDDEEEDESSHSGLSSGKRIKVEPEVEGVNSSVEPAQESVKEHNGGKLEEAGLSTDSQHQPQIEEVNNQMELDFENKDVMKEDKGECQKDIFHVPKEASEEQGSVEEQTSPAVENAQVEGQEPTIQAVEPESQSMETQSADNVLEQPSDHTDTQAETREAEKTPDIEEQSSTSVLLPSSENPDTSMSAEVTAAPVDPSVIGTPSQDEEDGVSDVESERSPEPQVSVLDISGMAARLLESWKDLKEVYRIPKKSQVEKEPNDRSRDRDTALTPRPASGSRERERERDKERERERDREYERDRDREWDRERDRDRGSDKIPRSSERWRRRSTSPPSSMYERSRRTEERFDSSNSSKTPRGIGGKERNKLSTEERRKLFEQEVAQREAQKQQQLQQQQQQQQLQTMAYDPALAYASSPGFITYPPGYPIQTFVDPSNPNAGKVLLPTPPVEPTLTYEQTPPQHLISELRLPSPSSTPQGTPVSNLSQHITSNHLDLNSGNPQQYAQPTVATQDPGVAVLSVPAQAAPQVQGQQSYTTLWDPTTQQAVTVQTQPAQQYAPAQPQTQTAIYYQGQPCQTIYSIPAAYPQTNTPVIQAYSEPTASYLHGQPVYTGHQQGVVLQQGGTVTTIVTSQTVQQDMIVPNNVIDLPPPSPPKPKTIVLPPNWKVARDPEGKIYYYHVVTRQTQWDPPTWEGSSDNTSIDHESEMDLGTPTYDENPSKFSTKTAEADTSSELAKKSKETFRKEMSQFIVQCLNPYRKPDCKFGRISNTDDFKHLARKLTHGVMNKELKACKNPEDLECNENVKHKTKEYIKKYMQRFGSVYRPREDTDVY
ncbi:histone-lysine N-methyltransferase SETD2 isoform X2 [Thalassophryne amazonica]|uniref:histone-lysine N-methyltransferase SETD2 isoform X2 n=1 Tax=Thalassophryne amazonica TaxID=390379 RepID=UPI00147183AC|nr:histone-lysine N-methyltransferase SETD2 isoform X2 [Thalassophryne amazonica]